MNVNNRVHKRGVGQSAASIQAGQPLRPSSGGLHPVVTSAVSHLAVSQSARNLVEEALAWQIPNGVQRIPSSKADECEERHLALRFAKLLLRRNKALGTQACYSQLSPAEVALVNSVPGVALHGSSMPPQLAEPAARQELALRVPNV